MRSCYPEGLAHRACRVTCWRSSGLTGESLCLQAFVFCGHVALVPVYLTALYVHSFATSDSKWRAVNIITPPVRCIEVDGLYASDKLLHHQAKGGPWLGELPAVVGGLWGDTHKVGFCVWSIFECVLF